MQRVNIQNACILTQTQHIRTTRDSGVVGVLDKNQIMSEYNVSLVDRGVDGITGI